MRKDRKKGAKNAFASHTWHDFRLCPKNRVVSGRKQSDISFLVVTRDKIKPLVFFVDWHFYSTTSRSSVPHYVMSLQKNFHPERSWKKERKNFTNVENINVQIFAHGAPRRDVMSVEITMMWCDLTVHWFCTISDTAWCYMVLTTVMRTKNTYSPNFQ